MFCRNPKISWDTFPSQIAELCFPYDRRIANDRRRSQKIEHGSIFCDRLDHDRRIADDRRQSQTIAEVCFHMIADDRRTSCDLRSSAIIWKPALTHVAESHSIAWLVCQPLPAPYKRLLKVPLKRNFRM